MTTNTTPKQPNQTSRTEDIREVFCQVFARPFSASDFTMDSVEEWDSLSHIKLIIALERTFSLRVSPEEMARLQSFRAIVEFVDGN